MSHHAMSVVRLEIHGVRVIAASAHFSSTIELQKNTEAQKRPGETPQAKNNSEIRP
jgi:hypothetical protein